MRCNASNIACGEHGTGRVAVYSRTEIAKRRYRHLEHELGAGIDKKIFDAVRPRYQSTFYTEHEIGTEYVQGYKDCITMDIKMSFNN